MAEIDVKAELAKYEAELQQLVLQLRQLDEQRATFLQAIDERQGIIAFLRSLNSQKETG
mgnify:CR=1 FL=1